ncbi:choice-of-anchor B family protein [Ulvibacter antarcticus]|uniref:Choice-of-anchor B domain-containing protein n=1 Tax=Ulvibacter antarcticus TaxID=442714 RepID=A0A3L9Z316_9FLAO|nr:choice-of-anchor B family protein [Ulvibacter antarcticus]RMA65819.1 choice-of-anchor B domain-containing protein [Ulvibacter antarcticus]
MKPLLSILLACTSFALFAQTPCSNGTAGGFACNDYDLQSQIPLSTMNSTRANDSWGWTDPLDGKEYAIMCLIEGVAFIDISDPVNPVYLGKLPSHGGSSTWRDAKTYGNFAFVVSEDSGHGMQIFDLTKLRDVNNPPVIFNEDAHYSGFGSAHNIVINEETAYAYGVGTTANGGGPHFVNIQDPLNPVNEGGYAAAGYCHDAYVVIYNGPDTDYSGREILFGSNETEVVIIDVTDKTNPQTISTIDYNNLEYTHQGWLTEDHRYFLLGDEQDEINLGLDTRTLVFDFEDLDNPTLSFEHTGETAATDHNGFVKGDTFYLSNNAAGLRVLDISEIGGGTMTEIGYFDTHIENNEAGYNGAWSVYPYFESGNIVISDRTQGFVLVKKSEPLGISEVSASEVIVFPNPASEEIVLQSEAGFINKAVIVDILGNILFSEDVLTSEENRIDISNFSEGIYFLIINNTITKKIIKK